MIKKIAYIGAIILLISSMVSCEKDYTEVGTTIIDNNQFESTQKSFEVSVVQEDISSVQADNINAKIEKYLLGIYKPDNYKKITASFVSQLNFSNGILTKQINKTDDTDSTFVLDKVILKIPYPATETNRVFTLDSNIGNPQANMTVKVFENKTYLNTLNPSNLTQTNIYGSDYEYVKGENLTDNNQFDFQFKATDTMYVFDRTKMVNKVAQKFKDTFKIKASNTNNAYKPFLAIPLDLEKMKKLFWDKFDSSEFASSEEFQNYFKGLIIQVEGEDGALIPLDFEKELGTPSLDFFYTITREENKSFKDVLNGRYSFTLGGVTNSIYKTDSNTTSTANTVKIQGTAGSMAKINLFTDAQLEEIRSINGLINDAVLTFNVNQSIDKDQYSVPQQLLLYTKREGKEVQLSDAYTDFNFFGGDLQTSENLPKSYTFRITNHLIDLVKGDIENTPLYLKVYNNDTDAAVISINKSIIIRTDVKSYNWNPKGVTLYDGNSVNGDNRVQLKVTYTKEK